jgi:hypothetical protein
MCQKEKKRCMIRREWMGYHCQIICKFLNCPTRDVNIYTCIYILHMNVCDIIKRMVSTWKDEHTKQLSMPSISQILQHRTELDRASQYISVNQSVCIFPEKKNQQLCKMNVSLSNFTNFLQISVISKFTEIFLHIYCTVKKNCSVVYNAHW